MTAGAPRSHRLGALVLATALAAALGGCGDDDPAPVSAPSGPSGPSGPSRSTAPAPEAPTDVDVAALAVGSPASTGVLADRTLVADGRSVDVDLPDGSGVPLLLGEHDGRWLVVGSVREGSQLYAVEADGSARAVGTPHETYNNYPHYVEGTGHVLFPLGDRGTGRTYVTVVDASSGDELGVHTTGADAPDPADAAVVDELSGRRAAPVGLLATSPDGGLGLVWRRSTDERTVVLTLRPEAGDGEQVRFRFRAVGLSGPVPAQAAFEDDETFLVVVGVREAAGARQVVVRCTTSGDCERAGDPAGAITLAGAGLRIQ